MAKQPNDQPEAQGNSNNIFDKALKVKTPIQLVAFFLALLSYNWLSKLDKLNSTFGILMLVILVLLVFSVIVLFFSDKLSDVGKIVIISIVFIGILSSITFLTYSFVNNSNKNLGRFNYFINVRDIKDNNISDMDQIELKLFQNGNLVSGKKNIPDGTFGFYDLDADLLKKQLKFELNAKNYIFSNNAKVIQFNVQGMDTALTLIKIPEPEKTIMPNTFSLNLNNKSIIKHIEEMCSPLKYIDGDNPQYSIKILYNKSDIVLNEETGTYSVPIRSKISISINDKCNDVIGYIPFSIPNSKRNIESYFNSELENLCLKYKYSKVLKCN